MPPSKPRGQRCPVDVEADGSFNDFITLARENGLRHLTCMLIKDLEEDAIATLKGMGFESYTIPGYGVDPDGTARDMVKMILKL